ncbi:condensation domain-containing protein [Paenibacillus thiaminolyticus]
MDEVEIIEKVLIKHAGRSRSQSWIREKSIRLEEVSSKWEEGWASPSQTAALKGMVALLLTFQAQLKSRLSGDDEVIVGSPVAGRPHADLAAMMGMFVNTLALRTFPSGQKAFTEYLEEIKQTALDAFEHGEYPFEELVDRIVTQRDMSRNPLFDAVFVLQNDLVHIRFGWQTNFHDGRNGNDAIYLLSYGRNVVTDVP